MGVTPLGARKDTVAYVANTFIFTFTVLYTREYESDEFRWTDVHDFINHKYKTRNS